jgi:DNA-binding SARP family transcriptional activator/tetratricopeptide (TPR) repeat protein
MTQQELAHRAGVSLGTVRDLEQGRSNHPRPQSMRALADVLSLDAEFSARLHRLAERRPPEPVVGSGPVRICVLGPLTVSRSTGPLPLGTGRRRAVLARLALTPNRAVGVAELVRLLWAHDPPRSAANVLQTHISRLRRALEPAADGGAPAMLVLAPGGYSLRVDESQLDLQEYQSRLAQWRRISTVDPQRAFDILGEALDLWQGFSAAEDVAELQGDALGTALVDEMIDATVRLARHGEALRRLPEVLPRLRRLAARHVWHEALHAQLVVALAASGQQVAALEAYDGIRTRLADDLGIDPGPDLVKARQAVLDRRWEAKQRADLRESRRRTPWQAPAPPDFAGRAGHLSQLEQCLRSSDRYSGSRRGPVCVISGMPGVGKTSLALRVAQSMRSEYPDGQLYINLRGADHKKLSAANALSRLLRGLGVTDSGIPDDVQEACSLYRTMLADRRVLVILDNARNAAQIRPLLPGAGSSAVLITSRNQCADLPGAMRLRLPLLTADEAVDLLVKRIGTTRVTAEPATARELVEACGRLPVALAVVAGRLAARPDRTLRDCLDQLADARSRLDELGADDAAVLAGFDLGYRELGPASAEIFRMAALIPGESFPAAAAAALVSADDQLVQRALDDLVEDNMLEAVGPGRRYRYHDLLRLYATQRTAETAGAVERLRAVNRMSDWYLARTAAAVRLIYPGMVRLPTAFDDHHVRFDDVDAAMAWLDDEVGTLVELINAAAVNDRPALAWQLADQLRGYFFICRDALTWSATGNIGLAAAETAGDQQALAAMHQTLGQAHWSVGRHGQAADSYRRGVTAAERGGWRVGEAYLLHNLGLVEAEVGRVDEARARYERVLRVGTGAEFTHIRAVTLNDLAVMCTEQGRLHEAVHHLRAALEINQGPARRPSAMANHSNLGMVLRQLDEFDAAREHLETALAHYRQTGSPSGTMSVLDELSQLHRQLGEWHAAVDNAVEALHLARTLDDPKSESGVLNTLGFALLGARAVTDAQARFEESLRLSRERGYQYFAAQASIGVAEAMLMLGVEERARMAAGEALEIARRKQYRVLEGDASIVLARIALTTGEVVKSADHCAVAQASYERGSSPGKARELQGLLQRIDAAAPDRSAATLSRA